MYNMFQSNNLLLFQEEVVKLKSSQALDTSLERSRVKEEVKIYVLTTYLNYYSWFMSKYYGHGKLSA